MEFLLFVKIRHGAFLSLLGGFGVIKEGRVNILCRDIEEASEINLEEAESLAATAKENMTKSDSKKVILKTN